MEHTDVCFAPVLTMAEAAEHPHNVARNMIIERNGSSSRRRRRASAAPSPRSTARRRTPASAPARSSSDWGIPKDRIDELVESGAVAAS